MKVITSAIAQVILLVATLAITILRCFVRLKIEARALTISDYLIWVGWLFTLIFVALQCKAIYVEVDHPLTDATYTDSVVYLKAVFASCFFFDFGLYLPKASITAFYWWLIPGSFRRMRIVLYISTAYLTIAAIASILTDILCSQPISDNWTIEGQGNSIWNSYTDFVIEWVLNFSADLLLFCIPFFIIKNLKLRQRQTIGLIGVFSLGVITMAMSFTRFMIYTVSDYDLSDADGAVLCTAEMCTSIIVANLPGLKVLITRAMKSENSPSNTGYKYTGRSEPPSRLGKISERISRHRRDDDSEVELISVPGDSKGGRLTLPTDITVQRDIVVERTNNTGSQHNVSELPFV